MSGSRIFHQAGVIIRAARGRGGKLKAQLTMRRQLPLNELGPWMKGVIQGFFNYHACSARNHGGIRKVSPRIDAIMALRPAMPQPTITGDLGTILDARPFLDSSGSDSAPLTTPVETLSS